ncbi:MAG: hypothetical protein ACUVS4_00125 [Chloroflexaceae bacterium]
MIAIIVTLTAAPAPMPGLLILCVSGIAYVLTDYFEVVFDIDQRNRPAMTLVDAPTMFLVPVAGAYGVLVVLIGSLLVDGLRRRPWYKGLFSASQRSIIFLALVVMYYALASPTSPPFSGFKGVLTFVILAGAYYTLNTILVSTIVVPASSQPVLQIYHASFQRVHWIQFTALPFGGILAYIWATNPWMVPAAVLPLFMAYRSFKAMAALKKENQRSHDLASHVTRLLDELRARQEELIRSSQLASLGIFAASMAHDFNNLLTAIYGFTQVGLNTDDTEEKTMLWRW